VSLEDSSPTPPTLTLLNTTPLNLDDQVNIQITIPWLTSGLLQVDFGDLNVQTYQILSQQAVDDLTKTYTIQLSHRYDTTNKQTFTVQAVLINHLGSSATSSLVVKFEASLPSFLFSVAKNVSSIAQSVSFKLESTSSNSQPVKVTKITVFFDYPNNLNLNT
jgi:hypothetical protein